jgi:hypothetical protein
MNNDMYRIDPSYEEAASHILTFDNNPGDDGEK